MACVTTITNHKSNNNKISQRWLAENASFTLRTFRPEQFDSKSRRAHYSISYRWLECLLFTEHLNAFFLLFIIERFFFVVWLRVSDEKGKKKSSAQEKKSHTIASLYSLMNISSLNDCCKALILTHSHIYTFLPCTHVIYNSYIAFLYMYILHTLSSVNIVKELRDNELKADHAAK